MEKCPVCNRIYKDNVLAFCVDDGARLVSAAGSENITSPIRQPSPTVSDTKLKKSGLFIFGGGIAVLTVFLLCAAVLAAFYVYKIKSSTAANANREANVQTAADKNIPEIKMAIGRANDAVSLAFSNYDTAQVRQYFSGEALKSTLAQMELLQKSNMYRIAKLESQDYEYIKVNDAGTQAEVRVTDTRSSVFKEKKSGKCIAQVKSKKTPQILYLNKKDGAGWIIDSIVYDVIPESSPLPCAEK